MRCTRGVSRSLSIQTLPRMDTSTFITEATMAVASVFLALSTFRMEAAYRNEEMLIAKVCISTISLEECSLLLVVIWTDPDGFIGPFHYGGQITFGPDGYMYLTQGDKYYSSLSQNMNYCAGKVLRFAKDGSFPTDNMGYQDGPGGIHDGEISKRRRLFR